MMTEMIQKHIRHCNWRTKLTKKHNFYKRNKDKIKNSKNKDWNWKTIIKEDNYIL